MGASRPNDVVTAAPALGRSGSRLRTIECVAQSLALGPLFSATVLGVMVAQRAGGVGPFVMVIATIGVLGLGWLLSELARRITGSGTVYESAALTLGRAPAVFTAGAYHLGAIALYTGVPIIGGILLKTICADHFGFDPPWWVAAGTVLVITIGLNLAGVQLAVRTQLLLVTAAAVPILILAVAVIREGGATGNTADVFNPSTVNETSDIFTALLLAILMFVGFELSGALGEETARPNRSIPLAMLAAILLSGAFYVITQYTVAIGGPSTTTWAFDDFPALGNEYVGGWLGTSIELAIFADVVAIGIGFAAATSRGLFSVARDGLLPSRLADLNRESAPRAATLVVGGAGTAVILLSLLVYGVAAPEDSAGLATGPPDATAAFEIALTVGAFVICVVYVLLALGGIVYFTLRERVPGAALAGLVGLAVAAAGVVAQFVDVTEPIAQDRAGRNLGIALLVVAAVWMIGSVVFNRHAVRRAASHATRHEVA
jgi:amino acid transporter